MRFSEVVALCIALLLTTFVVIFFVLPKLPSEDPEPLASTIDPQETLLAQMNAGNLLAHVAELLHIKQSVLKQLRDLEKKCAMASKELNEHMTRTEELREEMFRLNNTNEYLKSSAKFLEASQQELLYRRSPKVAKPMRLIPDNSDWYEVEPLPDHFADSCDMERCFDYARCPLSSDFRVFVDQHFSEGCVNDTMYEIISRLLLSPYATRDRYDACLFVVPVCLEEDVVRLNSIETWMGDGRNHVVVPSDDMAVEHLTEIGRALVASDRFPRFRQGFDVFLPLRSVHEATTSDAAALPPQLPAHRQSFIFFGGCFNGSSGKATAKDKALLDILFKLEDPVVSYSGLNENYTCDSTCSSGKHCVYSAWCYCGSEDILRPYLGNGTFSIVITSSQHDPFAVTNVLSALKFGAVPVVIGPLFLPFQDNIDWLKTTIQLPRARAPEVYALLRSLRDEDILAYRGNGRRVWDQYFASPERILHTLLDTIRTRLNIPSRAAAEVATISVFNDTFQPSWQTVPRGDLEENLGAAEPPYPSDSYQRNFTSTTLSRYEAWNVNFDAGVLFPYVPYLGDLPGDAKFRGSEFGFRLIGGGSGGSGSEFGEALGGNRAREQFTVVILTYQRETILFSTLARLNNLVHLNKVVVVWNSPLDPSEGMPLPKIHVPIFVHKASVNSLNNRFLPFDVIETEAVLSMDDDIQLRHDEIDFAFRVWRENRDRIVGFPARYHAWDTKHRSWLYNSNYTCEFSMVLTGASFFHKYYMYLYTSIMPSAIRTKVDEFMNCEDIAMNFLVAHQTRKPPIKVTSRWTFRCQDCPISLWEDESHFTERHFCIQYFERVYGYMPLLNSQFRADSVLFKTRIPADKQKCYKII